MTSTLSPPSCGLPCRRARRQRVARRHPVATAADEAFDLCREKVSAPKDLRGESATRCIVNFKGADGHVLPVEMPEDMYILNAAEKAGIDLPATCRGGICGACVGKVVSGKVDQSDVADLSFVLEQEQVDQGFALLCMARPVPGEAVTIEAQCDWGNISMSNWKGATFFTGEPVPLWKDDVKGLRG